MPVDGNIATLKLYWKLILSNSSNLELPKLAMLLLDIKPHAADPEKTVSLMGWYHSARRHSLLSATITAMTTVKMHYQTVRTDEKAKAEADAILVAMNASTDAPVQPQPVDHPRVVNTANSMELCSTAELIELFEGYTAADVKQKEDDYFVSESSCMQYCTLV
ncbi:TPA: hypothetical protein ACH3X1_007377 [Trebouxia sp. C0004]